MHLVKSALLSVFSLHLNSQKVVYQFSSVPVYLKVQILGSYVASLGLWNYNTKKHR